MPQRLKILLILSAAFLQRFVLRKQILLTRIVQIDKLQQVRAISGGFFQRGVQRLAPQLFARIFQRIFSVREERLVRGPAQLLRPNAVRKGGVLQFYLLVGENVGAAHVLAEPLQERLRARVVAYLAQDIGRGPRRQVRAQPAKLVVEHLTGDAHPPVIALSLLPIRPIRFPIVSHVTW